MDLTCKNRETVFKVYRKLTEIRDVSNYGFTNQIRCMWLYTGFQYHFRLMLFSSYLKKHDGAIFRDVTKVDRKVVTWEFIRLK